VVSWVFPASTATIAALFATTVFLRWRASPKRHLFLWTLGLYGLFGAAAAQAFAESTGSWPEALYRFYYFLVGTLVAALGAGSVYLMRQRKAADYFLWAVLGLSVAQAFACAFSALADYNLSASNVDSGARIASLSMRILVAILNIAGAAALIAGAVLSYLSTKRRHNLLILAGSLVFSAGGSLAGLFPTGDASTWALYAGNLIGITLLFVGFLTVRAASAPSPNASGAGAAAASPPS
jgi:hypothetical protein